MNEAREDYRLTLASCVLVGVSSLLFLLIEVGPLGHPVAWLGLGHFALAAVGGIVLWQRRRRPSLWLCQVVFTVVALYYLPEHWVTEWTGAQRGLWRDPLFSHQVLVLGVALLCPGTYRLAAVLIGVIVASAFPLWWVLSVHYPFVVRAAGEPWLTFAYAGVAAVLLVLRALRHDTIRRLARAQAERDALARVARLFVAVRDSTNTPLQTLVFGVALLERQRPGDPVLERMRNALARLSELTALLAAAEAWQGPPLETTTELAQEVEEASRALRAAFAETRRA